MGGALNGRVREDEASMATRAAWLHYAGGLTQSEVARRLGLTSLKAHRLITRANQDGLVKVFIDGEVSACVALENELLSRFGLAYCEVVPDFDPDPLPLKALGIAGAHYLRRAIERGQDRLIGVGHGRTLAACVEYLPRTSAEKTRFVSLLGGLTRKFAANPHDVIHRLAERTGAQAYFMPVPFFANTREDRTVLLQQRGISEVFDLAKSASLLIVGIGTVEMEASLVATGMIEKDEIAQIRRDGGVGELLGHFFDTHGAPLDTALSERTLALGREQLRNRSIVAIAGGMIKARAIRSVLSSGYLAGLITDERTARALIEENPAGQPDRPRGGHCPEPKEETGHA